MPPPNSASPQVSSRLPLGRSAVSMSVVETDGKDFETGLANLKTIAEE